MKSQSHLNDAARAEVLAQCANLGSTAWSDAMDEFGIQGVCSGLTQRSGQARCIGFAVTATGEVGELGAFATADLALDRMLDTAGQGEVLVVGMGSAEVSGMGGIAALAARRREIGGVVIDGGCRDVADMQSCGLWVASRHVTPRTGKRRVRFGGFGLPTSVGGVKVRQGDLVVADASGIVVVPAERLKDVMAVALKVHTTDRTKESAIQSGLTMAQARSEI